MGAILFLLLLGVPIAELYVIVKVAGAIGFLETLGLLIAISAAGAFLLRQQGLATWRRLQMTMHRGEVPTKEVTDGAMILLGGALLLTPGFITDAVGLLLLLPPTRAALKGSARRSFAKMAKRQPVVRVWNVGSDIYEARTRPVPRDESATPLPDPEDGDGSPDKG